MPNSSAGRSSISPGGFRPARRWSVPRGRPTGKRRRVVEQLLESPSLSDPFRRRLSLGCGSRGEHRSAVAVSIVAASISGCGGGLRKTPVTIRSSANCSRRRPVGKGPGILFRRQRPAKPENIAAGAPEFSSACGSSAPSVTTIRLPSGGGSSSGNSRRFSPESNRPAKGPIGENAQLAQLKIPGHRKSRAGEISGRSAPAFGGQGRPREVLADWIDGRKQLLFRPGGGKSHLGPFLGDGNRGSDRRLRRIESAEPSGPVGRARPEFVQHKYDVKFLVRAICASRPYQLSSVQTDPRQSDRRLFATMPVKGLVVRLK